MSAQTPSISSAIGQLTAVLNTINTVSNPQNVSCSLNVTGITYINQLEGTFTPANNLVSLFAPSGASQSPNFIFLSVDQPIGLQIISNSVNIVASVPVNKMFYSSWSSLTNPITNIKLDGTTAGALSASVQQGVLLNWYLLVAVCTIT